MLQCSDLSGGMAIVDGYARWNSMKELGISTLAGYHAEDPLQ